MPADAWVLLIAILAPLAAAGTALFARRGWARALHGITPVISAAAAAAIAIRVIEQGPLRYAMGAWPTPLGIHLEATGSTAALLLLVALVAAAAAIHAHAGARAAPADPSSRPALFWVFFYALWAALNALLLTADIFNAYVALELITLASVALVAQSGARECLAAALRYLFMALFGSILYLAGVALIYGASGHLDLSQLNGTLRPDAATWVAACLMTTGLAVKTALFPFHFWLPAAHAHAAAPVSAVLSALVVKASFFLLLRLWLGPFATLDAAMLSHLLGGLGAAAIIWGGLAAWRQHRLKLMIAYSTVAQIGYLFLIFPLFAAAPSAAWNAALFHVVAHGIAKAALFLAAGNILWTMGTDRLGVLARLDGRMRMSIMAMALAGVSLMGLPPAGGFVSKWLFLQAAIAQQSWGLAVVVVAGGLITSLYVFRLMGIAMTAAEPDGAAPAPRRVSRLMESVPLALAVLAFILGIGAALPLNLIQIGVPFAVAAEPHAQASGGWLPIAILLSSLLPGLAVFFLRDTSAALRTALTIGGAVAKVALVIVLLLGVHAGRDFEARIVFLPGLDLVLRADPLTLQFVTLSALLWLITTIYAIGYLADSAERSRFFGFFNLSVTASAGIALSGNLLTFLFFYEFLTLATYPLVVHRGTRDAIAAGRTYLIYTVGGGAAVLLGTVWLHVLGGNLDFSPANALTALHARAPLSVGMIFLLLIGGVGVKAALVPLHSWLPRAMVAPAPVSALLHAVAVVKAGVFGIIRVLYDVFGVTFSHAYAGTLFLAGIAALTIVYGSLRALYQDDLKKRLAWSTVSQLAYIVLGASLAGPIAAVGALVHIVHQGLMKSTLFFCAGNLAEVRGIHKVSEMQGAGRMMPWTMAAFTLAALGMIGLPPIAGFVTKWYLAAGGIQAGANWILLVLVASSVLNAAYFLPILQAAWFKAPLERARQAPSAAPGQPRRAPTWWLVAPPAVTAVLSLGAGLFAGLSFSPLGWAEIIVQRTYYPVSPAP